MIDNYNPNPSGSYSSITCRLLPLKNSQKKRIITNVRLGLTQGRQGPQIKPKWVTLDWITPEMRTESRRHAPPPTCTSRDDNNDNNLLRAASTGPVAHTKSTTWVCVKFEKKRESVGPTHRRWADKTIITSTDTFYRINNGAYQVRDQVGEVTYLYWNKRMRDGG